jgi:hypothetical protein
VARGLTTPVPKPSSTRAPLPTPEALALVRRAREARAPRTVEEQREREDHLGAVPRRHPCAWVSEAERRAGVGPHARRFGIFARTVGSGAFDGARDDLVGGAYKRVVAYCGEAFFDGYGLARGLAGVPEGTVGLALKTIRNHLAGTIAIDFLTVPTVTFGILYVFFVLSLERRRVLHINVTRQPHAAWSRQQIVRSARGRSSTCSPHS